MKKGLLHKTLFLIETSAKVSNVAKNDKVARKF